MNQAPEPDCPVPSANQTAHSINQSSYQHVATPTNRRLQQSFGQTQEQMEIYQLEEVDYLMDDMEEVDSINNSSLIILDKNQQEANKKQDLNIFNQLIKKGTSTSLIQQPVHFPQINTSLQHNESLGFLTQRSSNNQQQDFSQFNKNSNDAQDSIVNNSMIFEPNRARIQQPSSDMPLRTDSRDSIISGHSSIKMLLSPIESQRSVQNSSSQDQRLAYQLEALTKQLAERDKWNQDIDAQIEALQKELGQTKVDYEQRKLVRQQQYGRNYNLRTTLNFLLQL